MAFEGLLSQIAQGADTGSSLIEEMQRGYRFGEEIRTAPQRAAEEEQKSKLREIAIRQGEAEVESTKLRSQQLNLQIADLVKDQPLLDQERITKLQDEANKQGLQGLLYTHTVLDTMNKIQTLSTDQQARVVQSVDQQLTAHTSSPEAWQNFLQSQDGQDTVKQFPELKGDLTSPKVQAAIKSVHQAYLDSPDMVKYLEGKKIEAETAKYTAGIGLQKTAMTIAGREKVANINKDAKVQQALVSSKLKAAKATKNDKDYATSIISGRLPDDFPGISINTAEGKQAILSMGAQMALIGNTIMNQGYDQASAYEAAYSRIQGAFKAAGGDSTTMDKLLKAMGLTSAPAPSLTESLTIGVTQPAAGPKVGDIVRGYKFKGGNPADKANWEKQ